MKFSEQWLRERVDPAVDTQALAHCLTMAGLEVDAITPVAPSFSGVVVGKVLEVSPHPEADRLRICRVDAGSEPLTIVCGAANVAPGLKVPTALVGAKLPDGMAIRRAKLRGVESFGMLCSAKELGLGEGEEGLMVLPVDAVPGTDLRTLLQLDDVVIELGLTPNRGDCLGIAGIAREVSVLCDSPLDAGVAAPVAATHAAVLPIDLQAPEACPRYLGRVIHDIDPQAQTPLWMQERLRRCGLRSLGPVVDVTNYVLLELGQPMHAFDLGRIDGGIQVRKATSGESLTLLDGQSVNLDDDMLVIADRRGALALAGIMGGQGSAVGDATTRLFLESAFFAPSAIAGRARRLGLHTDSSHRFERGVDFMLPRQAIERATRLILDIAGGSAGPVVEAVSEAHLPVRMPIILREQRLERMLGYGLAPARVNELLVRLGMSVRHDPAARSWQVTPPSFRFDITLEADLIEEIARIHGYDRLPVHHPRAALRVMPQAAEGDRSRLLRRLLAARGYQEAITYSFIDREGQQLFDPAQPVMALANPISAETAVMRTSLWPGLVRACQYNLNRQQERVFIFEHGAKYLLQDGVVKEENTISGLACGTLEQEQWGVSSRAVDFHDVKADVEALLAEAGGRRDYRFRAASHPALHPGQSAEILADAEVVGRIGQLHPQLLDRVGLDRPVIVFEVLLDSLARAPVPVFRESSRYPSVRRDLALLVDDGVAVADLLDAVREAAGPLMQKLSLFDIYRGKGVDSGKKSVAMGLTLQDFSRTLTDGEIEVLIAAVLQHLQDKFGATLRD